MTTTTTQQQRKRVTIMTRKHFEAIAKTVRDVAAVADTPEARAAVVLMAERLADDFAGFNSNFNRRRFLQACGM